MAVIRLSGQTSTFFDFQPLMMDEFIPVVEFDRGSFNNDFGYLSGDPNETTLSEYIDEKLRKIQPKVVETEVRKIKLPFSVQKGCDNSKDPEGIITIKLSVSDPEITIISNNSIKVKYGENFVLEIDIQKKSDVEFYIDFYANDDNDNNVGELKDIHCGRAKVQFSYRSEIVIIVGTDAPAGSRHQHNSEDNFIRRVDRLLNTRTVENVVVGQNEFVYVLVSKSMSKTNIDKLNAYGNKFRNYKVLTHNAMELVLFINSLSNIRKLVYFGHGIEDGPLYEYGVERLPEPRVFKKTSFRNNATVYFATCNSKQYAEEFASILQVNTIGVEGTTFYGEQEISAGKITESALAGSSIAWRYDVTPSGISKTSYSLNQNHGIPFLRTK
ncbi:MAG: hypothetical protein JW863_17210 [Chitinispirillaceae bacterium]|nr:hypothetical protein [Chitinispirillaceae bacterium]